MIKRNKLILVAVLCCFVAGCYENSYDPYESYEVRRAQEEAEIKKMERTLDMLRFKCWYYERAIKDGNEDRLNEMLPDHLPKEIQALYDHAHEE